MIDITTRYRRTDPQTSREAAKNAASGKAEIQRRAIHTLLLMFGPKTAKELSYVSHYVESMSFTELSRRISECEGIERTGVRRDGSAEWRIKPCV